MKSLDEIKKETPLQPLPPANVSAVRALVSPPKLSSSLANFGYKRPVSQWTREEVDGYNRWVESFYRQYEGYLEAQADYVRLVMRSLEVKLLVTNDGTLPATDIDVALYLPAGVVPHDRDEGLPKAPEAPDPPPLVPLAPGYAFAQSMPVDPPALILPPKERST